MVILLICAAYIVMVCRFFTGPFATRGRLDPVLLAIAAQKLAM